MFLLLEVRMLLAETTIVLPEGVESGPSRLVPDQRVYHVMECYLGKNLAAAVGHCDGIRFYRPSSAQTLGNQRQNVLMCFRHGRGKIGKLQSIRIVDQMFLLANVKKE